MYGKLVAEDILCCIEDDLPYISNRDSIITKASRALSDSDYIGEVENEIIYETIYDVVNTMPPIIINTEHMAYSKK